tara:strand:- start:339 stop:1259 length:921 start_codon:yes stop_codon:yes gene_type:complete
MPFRKIIGFGKSSFVVSLPKPWLEKNNLAKGCSIKIEEENGALKIWPETTSEKAISKVSVDIDSLGPFVVRYIHALYKTGIDEITLNTNGPGLLQNVQKALRNQVIGFEIIEQKQNKCVIRNVSVELEGFSQMLRRTFFLISSMGDESYTAIKEGEFDRLSDILIMEDATNRFTMSCRRILNRHGSKETKYVGPLYYLVEELENIGDEYKYVCQYFIKHKKIPQKSLELYQATNKLFKIYSELFYKFSFNEAAKISEERKRIVDLATDLIDKSKGADTYMLHQIIIITQKIFNQVGPLFSLQIDHS